ncbi:MAG: glutathione S-transferase family protein [Deltaproteobacteria bacterium]|nr:glutathione S-transferase family protein [Deltaproteobacteria bacterium]
MKLLTSMGPNPRTVRMFMVEKGVSLDCVEIDLMGGENRRPPYTERNPAGQLPALELDDGRVLAETVAICEYLEELNPKPALIGTTPEERAETRMWLRRVELGITEHLYNAFRYSVGIELFRPRMRVLPEAVEGLKGIVSDKLVWLDGLLPGRTWIVGERFTLADIVLFAALDFGRTVGLPFDEKLANVSGWFARVGARPSAQAG